MVWITPGNDRIRGGVPEMACPAARSGEPVETSLAAFGGSEGASGNLESISRRPVKLLKRFGFKGRVFPVNPNRKVVAGLECFPDVRSSPRPRCGPGGCKSRSCAEVIGQCSERASPIQ
jgi:hypothetical protein